MMVFGTNDEIIIDPNFNSILSSNDYERAALTLLTSK